MLANRLNRELKDLTNNPIPNCSAKLDGKDITSWDATIIGPSDTPYENGIFKLKIKFTSEYPFKPPQIKFITKIYHCNINSNGNICLDILNKNWSPALSIGKVLISICSLLAEPNPSDPLESTIATQLIKNKKQHDITAREYTAIYANK